MEAIGRISFEKLLFSQFFADFLEIMQCLCLPRLMRTFHLTGKLFGDIFDCLSQRRVHSGFLGAGSPAINLAQIGNLREIIQ